MIVLWTVALLSLVIAAVSAGGSLRSREAAALRQRAALEAMADGAVQVAAFHLLVVGPERWLADGGAHGWRQGGVRLLATVRSDAGRINPNEAPAPLLAALLMATGVPRDRAGSMGAAMVSWRTAGTRMAAATPGLVAPGMPFESLDELAEVPGMTPELLAALRPHLTLWRMAEPDPADADPVVRRALAITSGGEEEAAPTPEPEAGPPDNRVVSVSVQAEDPAGHRVRREATLLLDPNAAPGTGPLRIVRWNMP